MSKVIAFEVPRPWPKRSVLPRSGRVRWTWPPLVTVWHQDPDGQRCPSSTWARHPWHWKLQVLPLQRLRRKLITRCAWCAGPSRKGDVVNLRMQPGAERARLWRGESGLFHVDCATIWEAHQTCLCVTPHLSEGTYGTCGWCYRRRGYGTSEGKLQRLRMLEYIPTGQRDPLMFERIKLMRRAEREREASGEVR